MRSPTDSALLFLTALAAGAFLGARDPGELVRASLLSGFDLETVAARGASRLSAAEIARSTGLLPGLSLDAIDRERVEGRLRRNPWIREARVVPLPPGRVLVEVREREPLAVVALGTPPQDWLVDEEGTPFVQAADAGSEPLPRLHAGPIAPGEPNDLLRQGILLARSLEARGLPPVQQIWLEDGDEGAVLELRGVPGRVVLGTDAFPPKLERLARLLAGAPGEVAGAARIDMRFGDRVVLGRAGAVAHGSGARPQGSRSG